MQRRCEIRQDSTLQLVAANALAVIEIREVLAHPDTPLNRCGTGERATYGPQTPAYSAVEGGIC